MGPTCHRARVRLIRAISGLTTWPRQHFTAANRRRSTGAAELVGRPSPATAGAVGGLGRHIATRGTGWWPWGLLEVGCRGAGLERSSAGLCLAAGTPCVGSRALPRGATGVSGRQQARGQNIPGAREHDGAAEGPRRPRARGELEHGEFAGERKHRGVRGGR